MRLFLFVIMIIVFAACKKTAIEEDNSAVLSPDITAQDIETYMQDLSDDSLHNSETGSARAAVTARYIADYFAQFGLQPPAPDSAFYQHFTIEIPFRKDSKWMDHSAAEKRMTRNVLGLVQGAKYAGKYILIATQYDHMNKQSRDSLNRHRQRTSHSKINDIDQVSDISGLLELAHYFGHHPPQKSILFVAFSGSKKGIAYFQEHPPVSLRQIQAVLAIDRIDRPADQALYILGTGISKGWRTVINQAHSDSMSVRAIPGGIKSGDYASFYAKSIPVLRYTNRPDDNANPALNNANTADSKDEQRVLEHLKQVILEIDTTSTGLLKSTRRD